MKTNPKHYTLLFIGIIAIITSSFGYYFVYNKIISQAKNHSILSQEIKKSEQNNKDEVKLFELSNTTSENRKKLLSYFVNDEKILDFIKSIEGIADDSATEVKLSAVSTETEASSTVGTVKLSAEIKGGWLAVNKAISLIENLPYIVSIESTSLNSSISEKDTKNIWTAMIRIKALSIK